MNANRDHSAPGHGFGRRDEAVQDFAIYPDMRRYDGDEYESFEVGPLANPL